MHKNKKTCNWMRNCDVALVSISTTTGSFPIMILIIINYETNLYNYK